MGRHDEEQSDTRRPVSSPSRLDRTASDRARIVWGLLKPYRWKVAFLGVANFFKGGLEAFFLVIIARTALGITESRPGIQFFGRISLSVQAALVFAALLLLARLFAEMIVLRELVNVVLDVVNKMRLKLAQAFLDTTWDVQQEEPPGTLQQLLISLPNQSATLTQAVIAALGAGLTLVALLTVSVFIDPISTIVVISTLGLLAVTLKPLRERISSRSNASIKPQFAFANGVSDIGSMALEIQSFGVSRQVKEHLSSLASRDVTAQKRVGFISGLVSPIYVTMAYGAVLVALIFVASLGTSKVGTAGAVMLIMLRSFGYGGQLQQGSMAVTQIAPFLLEVDAKSNLYVPRNSANHFVDLKDFESLEFSGVHFSYGRVGSSLIDVSLRVNRGETVGIIGPSGSGKSTLAYVLLGLRQIDAGSVSINGVELRSIHPDIRTSLISYVPQSPNLITGTVRENLEFFRGPFETSELALAAKRANILEEILALPNKFEEFLGEAGARLSGGQRQRVAIARALLAHPKILVLDEPTSALDQSSEVVFQKTVQELKPDVTVLVISHRKSTLEACDKILVIENGQVSAFGSKEEVIKTSSFYRQMIGT